MQKAELSSVTISQVWDDESRTDYVVTKVSQELTGNSVKVRDGSDVIVFYPESWPEIRDRIEELMDIAYQTTTKEPT